MFCFICNQKDNNQDSHLKGNYVLRRQWSEAPVPLHCWSRAKFFFHMPAWMKDIPGKMCILNWYSVNGWPRICFLFVLRFWHDKNFCSQLFAKAVVDTQLLFLLLFSFFPQSFPEVLGKLFLRLSLQSLMTRKRNTFHILAHSFWL